MLNSYYIYNINLSLYLWSLETPPQKAFQEKCFFPEPENKLKGLLCSTVDCSWKVELDLEINQIVVASRVFQGQVPFHVCVLKTQIWIMDWESRRLRVSRHLSRGRSSEPTTAPPLPKNLPARGNPINSRSTRRTPKITVSNTSKHSKDIQLLWKIRNKGNEKRSLTKVYFLS